MSPRPPAPPPACDDAVLRAIVEGAEAATGEQFFARLTEHLACALGVQFAFVSELLGDGGHFRTLALWGRGRLLPNVDIARRGGPCEAPLDGQPTHYPDRLRVRFPGVDALAAWRAESYCGVPVVAAAGRVVGHLAILDDRPMPDGPRGLAVLRIFAARVRAEIERLRAVRAVRESEERVARIIDSALDAIVIFDADRRIELFNRAAERTFGCPAADARGRLVDRFLMDPFCRALDRCMAAFAAGERPHVWAPGGLVARRGDGHQFPVEATLSHSAAGGRHAFTLILRDVEEQQRAAEAVQRLDLQNEYLREEIDAAYSAGEIVGSSPSLAAVLAQVRLVADTDSPVLITGETGTGKELVARAIHAGSRRHTRPLVKVNCAALPPGLIESELFGHERGAFTGATERRLGRFELAHGGSMFLDEIGEMPLETQVKLLRVLQEQEIERVGGHQTLRVDVRVIAATNRDLAGAIVEGRFRSDLHYRLNVFPLRLPPLRERTGDIPALVDHFVRRHAARVGRPITRVPPDTLERLLAYPWPGNVRELENVVERAVVLSAGPTLEVPPLAEGGGAPPEPSNAPAAPLLALDDVERAHIVAVLEQVGWRIDGPRGAAQRLGIKPGTLRSRMKRLGIERTLAVTS